MKTALPLEPPIQEGDLCRWRGQPTPGIHRYPSGYERGTLLYTMGFGYWARQKDDGIWLEPCRQFLKAAHQAHQVATDKNLAAKRKFLLAAGSNLRLTSRTLEFSYQIPWSLLQNPQNARPLNNLWNLWNKVRTHFKENFYRKI